MNRGLVNGLFHALGGTRLQAGTVCDTCCEEAWNVTVGPVGGADPEDVVHSDLVISWGADLAATNVHFWALVEHAKKKRGMPIVVIDPRRTRSAKAADLYLPIRIGTDAALALGVMHILVRDKLADRDYIAKHTLGFDQVEREILPKFPPAKVAEITGLAVADIEKFAAMYGKAKAALIRLGEGMTRLAAGGQALRAVALLPGVTGPLRRQGRRRVAAHGGFVRAQLRRRAQAVGGAPAARTVNHLRLGEELLNMKDPPIRALFISANNPAVTCPEVHKVRKGLAREDLFTVVHDPFMTDTARYADIVLPAATYLETEDLYRAYGAYWMQWGRQRRRSRAGEARSNFDVAQALAQRMGLTDRSSRCRRRTPRANCSRARPVPPRRPIRQSCSPASRSTSSTTGTASPSARRRASSNSIPSSWPSRACRRCRTGRPIPIEAAEATKWPLRLLTAPGYFQAHTAYLRRRLPARPRGQAVLHPAPRGCREARPQGWRRGAPVQRPRRDRPGAAGQRRDPARRRAGARPAPDRRGGLGHHQHAVLGPLHRHRRRRDLPEHLAGRGAWKAVAAA